MSTQYVERNLPANTAASLGASRTLATRWKAASLAAMHSARSFLKAVSEVSVRDDMLAAAADIAATRPLLAARLRSAARQGWAQ